jgi:hypothetical protein
MQNKGSERSFIIILFGFIGCWLVKKNVKKSNGKARHIPCKARRCIPKRPKGVHTVLYAWISIDLNSLEEPNTLLVHHFYFPWFGERDDEQGSPKTFNE